MPLTTASPHVTGSTFLAPEGTLNDRTPDLRRLLLGVLILGLVGATIDLLLLEHTDSFWQWIPLVPLGAALVAAIWCLAAPSAPVVRLLVWTMALNLAMGLAGLVLHYKGNVEFELEMYPTRGGFELVWEALKGATPTLAPGSLFLIGLVGVVACYGHPALGGSRVKSASHVPNERMEDDDA